MGEKVIMDNENIMVEESIPQSNIEATPSVTETFSNAASDDISLIIARFSEEIRDAETYFHFAQNYYDIHKMKMAKYLMLIAKDEYSHAEFIFKLANYYNIPVSDDDVRRLQELHQKMTFFLETTKK